VDRSDSGPPEPEGPAEPAEAAGETRGFSATPAGLVLARRFTTAWLATRLGERPGRWQVLETCDALVSDLVVEVVGEVATFELTLSVTDQVVIRVGADAGGQAPGRARDRLSRVAALSSDWGRFVDGDGQTVVWAAVPL
jgi:hypothetical protein